MLAKELDVSEATISRDLAHLMNLRLRLGENAPSAFDVMLREERRTDIAEHSKELQQFETKKSEKVRDAAEPNEGSCTLIETGDPDRPFRVIRFKRGLTQTERADGP